MGVKPDSALVYVRIDSEPNIRSQDGCCREIREQEAGVSDLPQLVGTCVCAPTHFSTTVPSLRVAVLSRLLRESAEVPGRLIGDTVTAGERQKQCSILEFDSICAAEVAVKSLKGKYYHELPSTGLVNLTEFLRSGPAPSFRLFFIRWTRLYERAEEELTLFQKKCFDIPLRIQWQPLPADLASGVRVVEEFISATEEQELLGFIDAQVWVDNLRRRVQHYGHQFLYDQLYIDKRPAPRAIPDLIATMLYPKLRSVIDWTPDQLTINEYEPGQGIGFHVDTHSAFTEGILVVSLGGGIDMTFRPDPVAQPFRGEAHVRVRSRSCLLFEHIARYNWLHGIKSRKSDWDLESGEVIMRSRRVSLTFRKLNWDNNFQCKDCSCPRLCDTQNPSSLVLPERIAPSDTATPL